MIDLKDLRNDTAKYIEAAKAKNSTIDFDLVLDLDKQVRELKGELQEKLTERNQATVAIQTKMKNGENADAEKLAVKKLKEVIAEIQGRLTDAETKFNELVFAIPNPCAPEVPLGKDDSENQVMYNWGEKPEFDFQPLPHREILEKRGMLDSERATKISGSRFVFIRDQLVLLEMALMQYVFHKLYKKWFRPTMGPNLVKENAMYGTGYFPADKDQIYSVNPWEDDLYLIGTSEVTTVGQHMNENIDINDLPLRYVSYSPCFRREAGSYGKDLKWLIRLHQFNKVEMVSFVKPEDSYKEHEFLASIEEEIYQELGIPYQKMLICSGDLWAPASKKYDLEGWFPGIGKYKELTSTSNTTDYQARRINCKMVNGREKEFLHILNGTGTSDRPVAAIVENYQTKDMRIKVPEVLQPFMGGMKEF